MPMVNSQTHSIATITYVIPAQTNNLTSAISASVLRSSLVKSMVLPPIPAPDTLKGVDDLIYKVWTRSIQRILVPLAAAIYWPSSCRTCVGSF
jgi:hypothetical protein